MVGERRGGDLLVPLGPRLQARPEELLRQRPGPDGHPEYLVRWTVLGPRDEEREPAKERQGPADGRAEHILMWLSASEARASCPSLLGGRAEAEGPPTEPAGRPGGFARDAGVDEASLREMGEDVRELVRRAARQLGRSEASPAASLLHTVHVLSAYASIGPLAGVFRDTGALDLLMTMLGGPEPQIRRSAGKMLRALAAHDAGSRAHVLLSLSQQDGIEQHMDFDSRSTLLELFAETKSFEEHCMAFEGISLPQIPGKVLFSLVKRYLCATSLLDQLSSGADPGSGEQGARAPSSEGPGGERGRRRRELEFSMAMGSLISELVRGMGWDLRPGQPDAPLYGFQPHVAFGPDLIPPTPAPVPHRRQGRTFRSPSDFSSCSGYAEYVQETLRPGMRVRMMEDYVVVGAGDEGEFQQSNDSVPPAQVLWLETGRTYCVHWHMLEILGPGQAAEEKAGAAVEKGLGAPPPWPWRHRENPCCVPYLQPRAPGSTDPRLLSRGEWWEILFFVKKLAGPEQQRLLQLVQESQGKEVPEEEEARAELSVPVELARKLVLALSERCRGATRRVLLSSYVYSKYGPQSGAGEREKASLGSPDASWEAPGPGVHFSNEPKPEVVEPIVLFLLSTFFFPFLSLLVPSPPLPIFVIPLALLSHRAASPSWFGLLPPHAPVPCGLGSGGGGRRPQVVQEVVRFLHRLASSNKDCAVVLCRLGAREALTKALAQPSAQLLLGPELRELLDHCQKQASLYGNLTTSILAGCIQLVLGQIEEHRRTQQPINIPFLDVFLRHLCQGSSEEVREDRCWKKVEVSSNPHRASKLTDHNPKTYWESNGSTGSHHITLHVRRGVLIRQLTMLVASEDSSYMPARVVVLGGDSAASLSTELNTVNVLPSASRVPLLENLTHFWPVIQIRIKRCQQGGIDTRVRGLELLGPKPTLWPLFREQLCRRSRLFYAVRAQAWSRDVTQDRTRLLRLFPRLNRALGHEQAFADRFLPDEEAGLALSRTCREALITPLVHSITRPGPDGLSPLAWLLDLYLDHREEARRARGRSAALASRVRRLSHLLVHVEAPPTPPPSPPPCTHRPFPRTHLAPSSPRQVSRFLAVAWKAPDFVPRFCGAFQRLQTAGTELFGACQAGFVLALRQGFAAALQQLPFLTASHVSEQFAHYIDELIQAGRVGSAESLEQLQQSLEPFLVLSGLELATSFEHFYRYYLGERLLGPGPCWLEEAVLDQIGLCFPNRLPQQMLSGLRAAAELQRHFRLFRLQQFDRRLLERGQEEGDGDDGEDWGPEAEPPGKEQPEEEEEEETAEEEQSSPEMRVLVLSPRCWPVSPLCYMHEPSKYLPQALSGYLGRFSDFYSHGEESGPRRRLQWTWLGWAELVFGAQQRLLVSTLQMWILLHFNEAQVTVETLLQSSGLALELLTQALGPLTSSPGPLTLHEAEGLPAEGVLRLREEATDGTEPPGPPLRLLPPKAYLSMEEDQGRALEKKRNLLSCLLVRILKTRGEGGLHVDHLVCLVLEAWKETAPPGGGFCSNADVLSCILHLLGQGYMRRREEQPQVLVYAAPEPTGPSQGLAHIPFCGGSRGSAAGTVTLR
uniref:Cullin 9 n=1 Tax=Ornithorhynchus anatinus TaxID=9258 RepID=A0A6I8PGQ5_ORNAN